MILHDTKGFAIHEATRDCAPCFPGAPIHEEGIKHMYRPTTLASPPALADLMIRLTRELARIRDTIHGQGTAIAGFEHWEHPQQVYLEALLPGLEELDAELCIQSGHIFVTLNRTED